MAASNSGARLLVVDDDSEVREALSRALKLEGFAVTLAADGAAALEAVRQSTPDALILDVAMPGIDGLAVARALRAAEDRTPILMLTARDAIADRVFGLNAGADDYLVKPFSLLELAARLRALTRRDDRARPTVLSEGDLRLDPAAKRAWRDGSELRLSPKEFTLLELFLRHPGVVLTRSQILEAAWDFAYDGTSNVVDQYVNYLRRKVDVPFGRQDIETVRGMGYRLRHEDPA